MKAAVLLLALLLTGCAPHYYSDKPAAISADFAADHRAYIRAVGIPNPAGTRSLANHAEWRLSIRPAGRDRTIFVRSRPRSRPPPRSVKRGAART